VALVALAAAVRVILDQRLQLPAQQTQVAAVVQQRPQAAVAAAS